MKSYEFDNSIDARLVTNLRIDIFMIKFRLLVLLSILFFIATNCNRTSGDIKDGLVKQYHKNGSIMSEVWYVDGKKDGPFQNWYDNGKLHGKGFYKNDSLVGLVVSYYKNGTLNSELNRNDNHQLHGRSLFWNDKGVLLDSGTYKNGIFEGMWKKNHDSGKLASIMNYSNGKMEGKSIYFNEHGDTVRVEIYHEGTLIRSKEY